MYTQAYIGMHRQGTNCSIALSANRWSLHIYAEIDALVLLEGHMGQLASLCSSLRRNSPCIPHAV